MTRFSPVTLLFALLAAVGLLMVPPAAAAPGQGSCPRPANQPPKNNKKVRPKVILKPESSSEILNFGGSRGTRSVDVVLLTAKPLPKSFSAKQLALDSPTRFRRSGQALESASLKLPRFSNPQILEHRKKIRLSICIDTDGAPAGAYSGQVFISGPPGVSSSNIAITVNAKTEECTFFLFLGIALLIAFLLLLFKAAKETKEKVESEDAEGGGKKTLSWKHALCGRFHDLSFIFSTLIALGAAFVAMRGIYDSNPAWGAEPWANVFALCGTAFGAAGVGSLITAFTPGKSGA